ncbi:hypothetical protein ILUMI_24055 [Ignelater luminosus]|uniref:Acyl-coenzyme A thioesterase 13 n=1 Tax=Ignelater luminosus TaxID=2038154 RepID=A0A8K0G1A2_IGNLU|nr:hypothetical protein ILUMI_24055 [Ignelater luminosus]
MSRTFSTKNSIELIREILKKTERQFDSALNKVKIITCEDGKCLAEVKVEEEHTNPMHSLHGGFSATAIDTISSLALLTYNNKNYMMPSVSIDVHLSYLKGAVPGDELIITAETVRAGKRIAYLKGAIKNKKTGDILVKATHTKCYLENGPSFTELIK